MPRPDQAGANCASCTVTDWNSSAGAAVEVFPASCTRHEGAKHGARLEVVFRDVLRKGRRLVAIARALKAAEPLQGSEHFVADLCLHGDEGRRRRR